MSDYMFMLESHLNPDQNRVVAEVQTAASQANVSLFLTGGAMRDMLGGFQIRDLDFTIEGHAVKLAKSLATRRGVRIAAVDEHRGTAELVFPGNVTAEISMARTERYARVGARPQVTPATIQEDLRRRDFTVNAIALSLNRASRGLLLDPMNGLAELGRRELSTIQPNAFLDDPSRLLRLIRLRIRLDYSVEDRTKAQYAHAREVQAEQHIARRTLCEELKHIAEEPRPAEVLRVLDEEKLLGLFSPALTGAKLNLQGLIRLERARRAVSSDAGIVAINWGPFFCVLTEKLSPRERSELVGKTEMRKSELDAWQKLPARARRLESALKSAKLKKPSQIYAVAAAASPEVLIYVMYQSSVRLVIDRIKNYLHKYYPAAQEITNADVEAKGAKPGTPKFAKVKAELIAARLDARPKKPEPPPVEAPAPIITGPRGRGR